MDKTIWEQWRHFKERYPQVLLLFKVDDQYRAMGEDAKILVKLFAVAMVSVGADDKGSLLMATLPPGSLDDHLKVLLMAGHRVGLCEQIPTLTADGHGDRHGADAGPGGGLPGVCPVVRRCYHLRNNHRRGGTDEHTLGSGGQC